MTANIRQELAALEGMAATQLRAKYRELFGEESRAGNRQWLFRRCAWRLQSLAEGDLSARARQRAKELANDSDIRLVPPRAPNPAGGGRRQVARINVRQEDRLPQPFSVLERPFKGRMHLVHVKPNGFEYEGRFYRSLSAVAYAISGSHWNGFLFFKKALTAANQAALGAANE